MTIRPHRNPTLVLALAALLGHGGQAAAQPSAPTPAATPTPARVGAPTPPPTPTARPAPVAHGATPAPAIAPSPPSPAVPAVAPFDHVADAHGAREARRPPTEEESLALAAMEGLISQPAERALPLLKKVLAGNQSRLVKERALFVLSQFGQPEAQALLLDVARGGEASLRGEAIRTIGIGGNPKSIAALSEIYQSGDETTRKRVLQAWLIAGRKAEVYQVAQSAKTDAEAASAIRILAAMGAQEELRKLGDQRKASPSLLEAYAISGDVASLRKIAEGGGEVGLRAEATRRIGIAGNDAARAALKEIYVNAKAPEIRDAALQGMLISGDQQGVLALYRVAKTGEEKRSLLRTLTVMGGDAALAAIDAALEVKK